uniref:Uncharacterized protein n=1 Tax=Parascaris univalens TaxID=6257 RepID=A0A914ZSB0_PARUN
MRRGYLSVPQMPGKGAYEVLTDGPIAIWHFLANREYRGRKRYAFQIYREAVPLCFLTMKHLSYVVMQSDVPIFVPKHMHVIVEVSTKQLLIFKGAKIFMIRRIFENLRNYRLFLLSDAHFNAKERGNSNRN